MSIRVMAFSPAARLAASSACQRSAPVPARFPGANRPAGRRGGWRPAGGVRRRNAGMAATGRNSPGRPGDGIPSPRGKMTVIHPAGQSAIARSRPGMPKFGDRPAGQGRQSGLVRQFRKGQGRLAGAAFRQIQPAHQPQCRFVIRLGIKNRCPGQTKADRQRGCPAGCGRKTVR